MPDYAGPLQRLVPSGTLWLVVAWPFAGLLWQVLVVRRQTERARNLGEARRALLSARNAGLCCTALAFASTVAHIVVLVRAPEGAGALFQSLGRGARFGQLDAQIDLLFDPLAAAFCATACMVALAAAALVAARPSSGGGWKSWAWLHLSSGGALVAFAGDGFVGTAVGWSMVGAAGAWLAGWNDVWAGVVAAMRSAVALGAMLVGAVLLFWSLGGSWDGDDYLPDTQARFAAARVVGRSGRSGAHDAEGAVGVARSGGRRADDHPDIVNGPSLTFTGLPGALVFVDDVHAAPMQSPFVDMPVHPGAHTLRIHTSDGAGDQLVRRVTFDEGDEEVALVALGPTLAFRGITDQLALRDREGSTSQRTSLGSLLGSPLASPSESPLESHGGPGGVAVVAASLLALLLAAGLMSGAPPPRGAPLALSALAQGVTTVALGPYLIARVAMLFPLAPSTWVAVESVGAAILLLAGWRAPTSSGIQRWLAFIGVAPAALGFLALGSAGVPAATAVMVVAGTATAALYLAAAATVAPSVDPVFSHGPIEDLLFVRAPVRLGALFASMDRWVVGAVVASVSGLTRAGAWAVATADAHVIAGPANAAATALVRAERRVEPAFGVTLGRVTWALLAAVALVLLARALWPGT
jgi:hypothetical protein